MNEQSVEGKSGKIALNTALMWQILGYWTPRVLRATNTGLFHSSFPEITLQVDQCEETTVEQPSCENPTQGPRASTRDIADSPTWFDTITSPSGQATGDTQNLPDTTSPFLKQPTQVADSMWEDVNSSTFMDITSDFFTQPFDLEGSNSSRWDFGIL